MGVNILLSTLQNYMGGKCFTTPSPKNPLYSLTKITFIIFYAYFIYSQTASTHHLMWPKLF